MMITLTALPVEIIDRICSYADQEAHKHLRLTCLKLAHIGTSWVFQKVVLRPNRKSYERLDNILSNPDICQFVSRIDLDIRQWNPYSEIEDDHEHYDRDGEGCGCGTEEYALFPYTKLEDQCLPEETLRIFTLLLEKISRLQSVVVRFHHAFYLGPSTSAYEPHHFRFRQNVMRQVMSALSSAPGKLPTELSIQHLHNTTVEEPDTAPMIAKVLGGLQSLRLNITKTTPLRPQGAEPQFFHPELSSVWLTPTASGLRHLTLYSKTRFGFYPKFDPRKIHFPHLRTLALGNHCFVHDSQLDWILSHASTLTELYLDSCTILFEVVIRENAKDKTYLDAQAYKILDSDTGHGCRRIARYTRRWSDYFRAFKHGLPHLQYFRCGRSMGWMEKSHMPFESEAESKIGIGKECYLVYSGVFGSGMYIRPTRRVDHWSDGTSAVESGEWCEASEEDRMALRDLHVKIGQEPELDADSED